MSYRLKDFSDDEIIVLDAALNEDADSWHDEEKEKIRAALAVECNDEVEARDLIPDD